MRRRLSPALAAALAGALSGALWACSFQPGRATSGDGGGSNVGSDAGNPADPDAATTADARLIDSGGDPVVDAAAADAPGLLCPATYMLTNAAEPESRYRLVTTSDDWVAAEMDCEDDGGGAFLPTHLVVLNNDAEADWVYDRGTTDKWVGATDVNTEGTFQAVTDQANPFFGNAASNDQPKDCMFVNQNETVMEQCNATFQYICECDGNAADPANF